MMACLFFILVVSGWQKGYTMCRHGACGMRRLGLSHHKLMSMFIHEPVCASSCIVDAMDALPVSGCTWVILSPSHNQTEEYCVSYG